MPIILAFRSLFTQPVWGSALVLWVGAILAPGKRTVSAILRVMGQKDQPDFQKYHRVLNRAVWSSRRASQLVLEQIVQVFVPNGEIVMGIDDTIERRWGKRIAARGIYRDPVRSSDSHFVKTSGLRWLSLMLLVKIPWAQRVWALPFFTVLAPSQRYNQAHGHRHKSLTDWARQMLTQVRRWVPHRAIVLVADSSFAALELLESLRKLPTSVHVVTRLRLDAALYESAPQRHPKQMGRPRKVGKRLPTLKSWLEDPQLNWQTLVIDHWYGGRTCQLHVISQTGVWYHTGLPAVPIRWVLVKDPKGKLEPQAFLSTDLNASPEQILRWFRQRWQVEVTFEEVRAHLGVESQRQWSDLAILRSTPALLALFSIVVLLADQLQSTFACSLPHAAWYRKQLPTFSDALAWVRKRLWQVQSFHLSGKMPDMVKIPKALLDNWSDLLCYAA
jgi:DDE superfamily endonuclease/Archaeal putative transposase ISC1217